MNCRSWFIVENCLMYYLCHNIFIYWKSVLIDAVYISLWLLRCHLCHTEHYFSLTSTVPPVSYRTMFLSDFYCATCVIQNNIYIWLLLCHLCHTERYFSLTSTVPLVSYRTIKYNWSSSYNHYIYLFHLNPTSTIQSFTKYKWIPRLDFGTSI